MNLDEKLAELDPLLPEAVRFAIEKGTISITPLRRKFAIGYPRAARLIDFMEDEGLISQSDGTTERTVLVKKEDLDKKSSATKPKKRKDSFTEDQKTMLKEHKKEFNLDNLKLMDENGRALSSKASKNIKDLLIEQFCGIGIVCMEFQDAEVFFKKNSYVMRCKTFESPNKKDLKDFVDKNKIGAAMILFEVSPQTQIADIATLFPKKSPAYFAIANPSPAIEQIKVNILY